MVWIAKNMETVANTAVEIMIAPILACLLISCEHLGSLSIFKSEPATLHKVLFNPVIAIAGIF
jgi:hypothetical protein